MADISAFGRRSVIARVGADGELETRPGEATTATGGSVFTPAAEKYDVEATIGHGGMGEVMLVRRRDTCAFLHF